MSKVVIRSNGIEEEQEANSIWIPSLEALEGELKRTRYEQKRKKLLRNILLSLGAASSTAILVAILFLPILRIYGTSMAPTLYEHDIVVSVKSTEYQQGDVVSFYYNNNILVKRAIAFEGDWVDIDPEGNVYVNGKELEEPYVDEKAFGICDIELPYQVPDGKIFVIGDHRATSKDSRSTDVGSIEKDKFVGKIVFRLWPLNQIGKIE